MINYTLYFKFDIKYFVSIKNEKKSYIINDSIISKKGSSENVILKTLKNTVSGNSIIPILFSDYIRKHKKEINNAYYKKYNRFENLSSSDINLNSLIVYFENKKVFLISNHSQVYEVQFVLQIDD